MVSCTRPVYIWEPLFPSERLTYLICIRIILYIVLYIYICITYRVCVCVCALDSQKIMLFCSMTGLNLAKNDGGAGEGRGGGGEAENCIFRRSRRTPARLCVCVCALCCRRCYKVTTRTHGRARATRRSRCAHKFRLYHAGTKRRWRWRPKTATNVRACVRAYVACVRPYK